MPLSPDYTSILVIDDECDLVDILGDVLGMGGFQVAKAVDRSAALREFADKRPFLVISDLNMPHCSGFDLCLELRQLNSAASFVLLTGSTDGQFSDRCNQASIEMVEKPVPIAELMELAKKYQERASKISSPDL